MVFLRDGTQPTFVLMTSHGNNKNLDSMVFLRDGTQPTFVLMTSHGNMNFKISVCINMVKNPKMTCWRSCSGFSPNYLGGDKVYHRSVKKNKIKGI